MDNMRSHHVKAVREILEAKGMKVLYLLPYSPDTIQKALSYVSPLDCSHWFAASDFCYDF